MSNVDTNVDHYTLSELLTILDLNVENLTDDDIISKTDDYIQKFTRDNNDKMSIFFQKIQYALLGYSKNIQDIGDSNENDANDETAEQDEENTGPYGTRTYNPPNAEYSPAQKQTDNWFKNQALRQSDPIQQNKTTDRKQKIDVYNNNHVPMKREQLGISNNFNIPVAQDTLNPNLENVIKRFVNLDSRYRQVSKLNMTSTDYTLDLSEPLVNTLSLKLYSFQIPYSWYNVNAYNCCFWVSIINEDGSFRLFGEDPFTTPGINVTIPPGNYASANVLVTALNLSIDALFTLPAGTLAAVSYNSTTGKITINLNGATLKSDPTIQVTETSILTFFDVTGYMICENDCSVNALKINNSLGWLMGYRNSQIMVLAGGNVGEALLDLTGTKYLIIALDDYNQNHINNGLIGITEYSNNLKLPSYYNPSMFHECIPANAGNISANNAIVDSELLALDKSAVTYVSTKLVIPTAPRILTQAQIYTINQIMKNNDNNTNYRLTAPTTTDTFAIIPIKGSMSLGDIYVDFSGSLQDNKRTYFGPVNVDRIHLRLLDDKGNLLNLNGLDWSITLISENLYQY